MDPVTLAAISATVGGASGKMVEKAWNAGERWLTGYYENHEQTALEQAKSNSLEFLADLAHRVGRLEEEAGSDKRTKQQIESALGDPDFSILLKDAMLSSARTTNKDKHALLARIVAERLKANTDDLLALSSNMACEAVERLTPKQISFLGLAVVVYNVRPGHPFPPGTLPSNDFGRHYVSWLTLNVGLHLPMKRPTNLDLFHLSAAGCIYYVPVESRNMVDYIGPKPDDGHYRWPYDAFLNTPTGKQLRDLWEAGICRAVPTSVGQLVGINVHDELQGGRTIIDW